MNLSEKVKQKAFELGFDLVGITSAEPLNPLEASYFKQWLEKGYAAQMDYFHKNFDKRLNPSLLLDGAKSVIVAAINYKPPPEAQNTLSYPAGKIASYAQYKDYTNFIENKLRKLADFLSSIAGSEHKFKIFAGSGPVAEKTIAARAGLGFIGKNHLLINPLLGPQLLLGEIITTIELKPDKPLQPDCQNCDKCIKSCPTGALCSDGFLDANRCISYLTIERKSDRPIDITSKIGDRLFGCDDCILACPYYEKAPLCSNKEFKFNPALAHPDLNEILRLTQEAFDENFSNSPIRRIGLQRLKRNARICLENEKRRTWEKKFSSL